MVAIIAMMGLALFRDPMKASWVPPPPKIIKHQDVKRKLKLLAWNLYEPEALKSMQNFEDAMY